MQSSSWYVRWPDDTPSCLVNFMTCHRQTLTNYYAYYKTPSHFRVSLTLTSVVCKTMEHILYSYIAEHLKKNNILTPRQHGFRRNYSCETQLVITINDWAKTIYQRHQADVMKLDLTSCYIKGCYPSCRRTEFEARFILGWLVFLHITNNVLSSVMNHHNGFQCHQVCLKVQCWAHCCF